MGFGGVSIWQLLIVLVIVLVLFGTKKLRSLGSDLGGAVQGFKKSLKDGGQEEEEDAVVEASDQIQEEVDHEEVVSTAQTASAKKSAEQKPAEPKTAKQKPAEQKT